MRAHADYVYRDAADGRRARVFRRDDGRWDFEVFHRLPGGGWYVGIAAAVEGATTFDTKRAAMIQVDDCIGHPIAIDVTTVCEGWPEKPPPYRTPKDAPPIIVGGTWTRGRQVTRVIAVVTREGVLRVTTRNVVSAKESTGRMITNRKPADWTYSEETFRKKFKPVT